MGAAIEAADGTVYAGANIENAAYGITMCAERVALGNAVVAGARGFRRIVIVTGTETPTAPCGACRQALSEFGLAVRVESVGASARREWTLSELLPDHFGPGDLAE